MKEQKGFTLIELLAVIVILAVIALIAVPQIMKILAKVRLNAAIDTTYGIAHSTENYVSNFMLANEGSLPNEDLVFNCSDNDCILTNKLEEYNLKRLTKLSFKGTKPTGGIVTIDKNGESIIIEDLLIGDFVCNYPVDGKASCIDKGSRDKEKPLVEPTFSLEPSGYSQSKEAKVNFKGSGTYLIKTTAQAKIDIEATECEVSKQTAICNGEKIEKEGTLKENKWYKVESNPTLTYITSGTLYYEVTNGVSYISGGALTITEIDRTAPTVASVTQKNVTTNSITVEASGTDNESGIYGYQFSIDGGEWLPSTPQTSNEYTFTGVTSGNHSIKARVINGTYTNNGQNSLNTTESSTITLAPGELITPTASSSPSGWSQSKTVTINFTGSGTYLIKPMMSAKTNIAATECPTVTDNSATCNGTNNVSANGILTANKWYQVASSVTLTIEANGEIYYKVVDGTNYKNGGSLTIREIDRVKPILTATYKTADGNDYVSDTWTNQNIIVTLSGADDYGEIDYYERTYDGANFERLDKNTTTMTFDQETRTGIWFRAIDKAGNIGPLSTTNVIAIDKTPPKVTYSVEGNTYYSIQTVRITVADDNFNAMNVHVYKNGVGVAYNGLPSNTFDVQLDSKGDWVIYTFATDKAGNKQIQEPDNNNGAGWYYQIYTIGGPTSENPPSINSSTGVNNYTGVKKIVYLDPTNLNMTCTASNSVSTPGTKTGCMKWYVYADDGTNYTMILDHNTTANVSWVSKEDYIAAGGTETDYGEYGNNNLGPITVTKQLQSDTTGWNSSLSPRLITANEIATITGNTSWTKSSSSGFYLDSNSGTLTAKDQGASKYAWLYDYTSGCTSYGCNISDSSTHGYWTSTPHGLSYNVWDVHYNGTLYKGMFYVNNFSPTYRGVRPVITVNKSYIS